MGAGIVGCAASAAPNVTPASTHQSPTIDGDRVTFVYRAAPGEQEIRIAGDFATLPGSVYWDPAGLPMQPTADADVYAFGLEVSRTARLEYAFVVDGERRLDALNSNVVFSGVGGGLVSELTMPDYPKPEELTGPPPISEGTLDKLVGDEFETDVWVYKPAGYDPSVEYPVVYTADGSAWIEYMAFPEVLDRLIDAGAIEPVVAVMVDPTPDRRGWYAYNPAFVDYIASVVEHIDEHLSTDARPSRRLHMGTSAGAKATLYLATRRPDLFGKAAAFSPSVRADETTALSPYLEGSRRVPASLTLFLSAGSYEGFIYDFTRAFAGRARDAGASVHEVLTHEGHSFEAWKNHSARALEKAFPPAS